jgi:hypothetical protein
MEFIMRFPPAIGYVLSLRSTYSNQHTLHKLCSSLNLTHRDFVRVQRRGKTSNYNIIYFWVADRKTRWTLK